MDQLLVLILCAIATSSPLAMAHFVCSTDSIGE